MNTQNKQAVRMQQHLKRRRIAIIVLLVCVCLGGISVFQMLKGPEMAAQRVLKSENSKTFKQVAKDSGTLRYLEQTKFKNFQYGGFDKKASVNAKSSVAYYSGKFNSRPMQYGVKQTVILGIIPIYKVVSVKVNQV
ncbi:hypothetical protein [Secundilactobacillus yichangensis]|uniref:hypothetical protein n=1 Tax=Secundilactobacillus yichangensis TaxID=2799580 RepID=UPI001941EE95|nr:hypothetical protein [Secundilactobacillus yichangensis]